MLTEKLKATGIICVVLFLTCVGSVFAYDIGVYYYPGWDSVYSKNWDHIKGLPGSKSPGKAWPDREPLIGYYPEEQQWVADKHIEQASANGITFFAYEWFWGVTARRPNAEHAIVNHLKSKRKNDLKFCIMWANHWQLPDLENYQAMVKYWIDNYFKQAIYYTVDGKPIVFIISPNEFARNAKKFGTTPKQLLEQANKMAQAKGLKGIFFVAETNEKPGPDVETSLKFMGYDAYTGWNYVTAQDKSQTSDYQSMVDTYLNFYMAAETSPGTLPYVASASPGWDARPWKGDKPFVYVRENSTPEKFEKMLIGAKKFLDSKATAPKILMIEAWNEFGEGSYIEPTKKWGMQYLETIKNVFAPGVTVK